MKSVCDMKPSEKSTIVRLHGRGPLKRRFSDMGVTKGTVIEVVKVAPLGDPIQINLKGYELTIRKEDAKDIEVE